MDYVTKTKTRFFKKDGSPRKVYPNRVLTDDQVMAMRRGERDYKDVAVEAGISMVAAWFALRGYCYKDLPMA